MIIFYPYFKDQYILHIKCIKEVKELKPVSWSLRALVEFTSLHRVNRDSRLAIMDLDCPQIEPQDASTIS